MTTCKEWIQPDGTHFRGLCTNEMWPKAGTGGCNLCITPRPLFSACTNCYTSIPSASYLVTLSATNAPFTEGSCGNALYEQAFVVRFRQENCRWESDEREIGVYFPSLARDPFNPAICTTAWSDNRGRPVRPRIVLIIGNDTLGRTTYTVQVNWSTDASGPGITLYKQITGVAFARATKLNCRASLTANHQTITASGNTNFITPQVWASPWDTNWNIPRFTATVAPL